jgi:hypothetical protein
MLTSVMPGIGLVLFGPGTIADGTAVRIIDEGAVPAVAGFLAFRAWRRLRASPSVPAVIIAEVAAPLIALVVVLAARSGSGFPVLDLTFLGAVCLGLGLIVLVGRSRRESPSS